MTKKITLRQTIAIVTLVITLITFAIVIINTVNNNSTKQPIQETPNLYTTRAIVVHIDKDLVMCEDTNGEMWCFEGADEWTEEDEIILLMNDNSTEDIYDDEVIDVCLDPFAY